MANDKSGPLKSRLRSFLRSPLASESDLKPSPPAAAEINAAAENQKSERKRKIDFVRREELNYLRKLHQLQGSSEHPQSWSVLSSRLLVDSEDRVQTLKKINEIEAQMLEQDRATVPLSSTPPQEIRTQAGAAQFTLLAQAQRPTQSRVAPELEYAAIGFAKGDDAGVEQELLGYLQRDQAHPALAQVWLNALLGLYRATGQQAQFEASSAEFKRRFGGIAAQDFSGLGGRNLAEAARGPSLVGDITGDAAVVLENLAAAGRGMKPLVIDCRGLIRFDFSATVSLLNWTVQRQAEATEIHFQNAHPLVATFFNVMGIGKYARIVPSGYGDGVS